MAIHPFANGNGRCMRLLADLYLETCGAPAFSWGHATTEAAGATREVYLIALRTADAGDIGPLMHFARS